MVKDQDRWEVEVTKGQEEALKGWTSSLNYGYDITSMNIHSCVSLLLSHYCHIHTFDTRYMAFLHIKEFCNTDWVSYISVQF